MTSRASLVVAVPRCLARDRAEGPGDDARSNDRAGRTSSPSGCDPSPACRWRSSFDVGEVFRVRDPGRASSGVEALTPWTLRAVDEEAAAFAVAGLPPDAATVPVGAPGRRIRVTDPRVGVTEFATNGGPVRIAPRRVGPQLVAFTAERADDGRVSLVVRPAAHVDLDGQRIDDGGVATFDVGTADTVEAIGTPRGLVTMHDGIGVRRPRRSARITAYARSPEAYPLEGSLLDVRDCNASDPRSLEELGIGADPLPGGTPGVSLHAEEHVACSRLTVAGASDREPCSSSWSTAASPGSRRGCASGREDRIGARRFRR